MISIFSYEMFEDTKGVIRNVSGQTGQNIQWTIKTNKQGQTTLYLVEYRVVMLHYLHMCD